MDTLPSRDASSTNLLFPVFLKMEQLRLLIVGGGKVGLEKLSAVLSNSPGTEICLVASEISTDLRALAEPFNNVKLMERLFLPGDADACDLAIIAVNDPQESKRIRDVLRNRGKLVNVADQPALCDFYLGSIVQKGNLKLAVSTNGKSPTVAKRLKEWLNDVLPEEIDLLLDHMQQIREGLKGDFQSKVERLNAITKELAPDSEFRSNPPS